MVIGAGQKPKRAPESQGQFPAHHPWRAGKPQGKSRTGRPRPQHQAGQTGTHSYSKRRPVWPDSVAIARPVRNNAATSPPIPREGPRSDENFSFGAGKPDSVPPGKPGFGRHFSRSLARPRRLRAMRHTRGCGTGRPAAYFALHQTGFFLPPASPLARWALTPPFHPYPERAALRRFEPGGLFSVTLSVAAP